MTRVIIVAIALAACVQNPPPSQNYGSPPPGQQGYGNPDQQQGYGPPSPAQASQAGNFEDPNYDPNRAPTPPGGREDQIDSNALDQGPQDDEQEMEPSGIMIGGQAVASNGQHTCAKAACSFSCPDGGCRFFATKRARVEATCSGGNCQLVCQRSSDCRFTCSGGGCRSLAGSGARLDVTCGGGGCQTECRKRGSCNGTCSGGGCNF